jgi:uncharacterized protein
MDWLAILLGAAIGLTVGITGVGGGVLVLPTLMAVFGLNPTAAVATAFVFAFFSRLGAASFHYRLGNIQIKLGALVGVGGLPAIFMTSLVFNTFDKSEALQFSIRVAFFLVVLVCMLLMLFEKKKEQPHDQVSEGDEIKVSEGDEIKVSEHQADAARDKGFSVARALAAGFATGLVIGVTSVGGGVLVIPLLIWLFDLDIRQAVGTGILASLILAFAGFVFMKDSVAGGLVVMLLLGSIPSAILGAALSKNIPQRWIRALVIFLMLVAAGAVFVK